MAQPPACPLCDSKKGVSVCCDVCKRQFGRSCCKRYLALAQDPCNQVLTCNECFLKNVAWDPSRTYDVFGPESGRTIVLVHGALIGRQCMVLEARVFAAAGYRVIAPDLPAHGARFKEEPLTLDNAVSTLHEVILKEAPGKKVVLMGFSMGGFVAAAYAAAHPDSLAGVVMSACAHDCHTLKWKMVGHLSQGVYAVCSDKTKSQFIYKNTHSGFHVMDPQRPEIQECFTRAGAEMDAWKYTWRVMHDANMRKLLPQITCPSLLAVGETDYRSHEKEWLSLLQHGWLLVVKGGIHAFTFQPGACEEFRRAALKFAAAASWDDGRPAGPETEAGAEAGGSSGSGDAAAEQLGGRGAEEGGGEAALAPAKAVGVGVVFENVLAQFRPMPKGQAALPASAADGGAEKTVQ